MYLNMVQNENKTSFADVMKARSKFLLSFLYILNVPYPTSIYLSQNRTLKEKKKNSFFKS